MAVRADSGYFVFRCQCGDIRCKRFSEFPYEQEVLFQDGIDVEVQEVAINKNLVRIKLLYDTVDD